LAISNPEGSDELAAKADLARAIRHIVEARGLFPREAAPLVGVSQPDLSNLYRRRLADRGQRGSTTCQANTVAVHELDRRLGNRAHSNRRVLVPVSLAVIA
jgi:hypothetical protein